MDFDDDEIKGLYVKPDIYSISKFPLTKRSHSNHRPHLTSGIQSFSPQRTRRKIALQT